MIYFVYPRLRKLSGAERLILRLADYTVQLGAPVTLVTHYLDASCVPALGSRVNLAQTGDRLQFSKNHYLNAPFEYLHSIRLNRYIAGDAAAVTYFGPPSLPALAWSSLHRGVHAPKLYFCYEPPRFVYDDSHEVTARMGLPGALARPFFGVYKRLDRAMVRRADALLANSHYGAARVRAAYGRDAHVITHGADFSPSSADRIQNVREKYALNGKFVWLTVNFLHPRKRIDLFLRAFQRFHAEVPKSAALIVGGGPEQGALHALRDELELADAVHLTGFVPETELTSYYGAGDLYVHAGKNESFGLSVLEASAARLPVIAVNEGGPREIITDEVTGMLVEPSPGAIADAALALTQDPKRRAAMGAAGQERAHNCYSWERGAHEFLDVISAL